MTVTKPQWRTYSIQVNPKRRKAVALQAQFPLSLEEWYTFMNWLQEKKPELVESEPQRDD